MLKGLFTKGVYPRKWEALIRCFPSTCLILVYFLGGFGHRKAVKHPPRAHNLEPKVREPGVTLRSTQLNANFLGVHEVFFLFVFFFSFSNITVSPVCKD